MITFLACLSAFPALSTDLYLPALPGMAKMFDVSESLTNMTLISFFIAYGVMSLLWGPISDKIGRKPVLIMGCGCYMVAGVLCAIAPNVYFLIFARILQATGGAACTAMGTAIVKDSYKSKRREFVIAMVQSINIICPTIAPFFGALLLSAINWRGIFMTQAAFGLIVLIGAFVFSETIEERLKISLFATLGRLIVVLKNKNFVLVLMSFTVLNASGMAFVGVSSYIYIDHYGLSPKIYSLFFAFNAICMIGGPFIYMFLVKYFERSKIVVACLIISIASGVAIVVFSDFGPFAFALSLVPSFIAASCLKPPGMLIMLNQQKNDTGSASSLIMSMFMLMGAVGIVSAGMNMFNFAVMVGIITVICSVISIGFWLWFSARNPASKEFY